MAASETAADIASAVRKGDRTAESVTADCLDRIEKVDRALGAFIHVDRSAALQRARQVDQLVQAGTDPGPLAGVPVAVKDNICTRAGTTTCGSRILDGFQSRYDAHVIERLLSAGAVIAGKTNLDEFAMGSSTEHSTHGPTANPWNPQHVPGGSSGGSAAAVAARLVPLALGSDTGGSVRQPASFCGVVGLKPSYGRVSRYGLVAYGSSLDAIGPIATNARDAAMLFDVIAGHDPRDSTSVEAAAPQCAAQSPLDSCRGLKIGISEEYFGDGLDAEVQSAVTSAVDTLRDDGATIQKIRLPHMKYAVSSYYVVAMAEASSNLARFDGVHYGYRSDNARDIHDVYAKSRGEGFGAEVKRRIMLGTYVLSSGYYEAYYLKALKVRTLIKLDFDNAFRDVDVIASPVSPTIAFRRGEKQDDPLSMYLSDIYTVSANLAGIPGISLPCGQSNCGLPIGLQLMAPVMAEQRLLAISQRYQLLTAHHRQIPDMVAVEES